MKLPETFEIEEIEKIEHETLNAILIGQTQKVKSLYLKIETMFNQGGDYTKSLIANKFIFPISSILERNYEWGKEYLELFPKNLRLEYLRQINSSTI